MGRKRIVIELDVEDISDDDMAEVVDGIDNVLDNGGVQEMIEETADVRGVELRIVASRVYEGKIPEGNES